MVKNITLLDDNELKDIYPLIKESMEKIFFEEHLKALIIALLSNHRWGDNNIRENIDAIDGIFHNYNKNYLKVAEPKGFVNKLRKVHCINLMISYQMKALSKNIMVLNIIKKIAILNNCDEIIVESIIQQFCLLRSTNICANTLIVKNVR